MKSQKGSIPLLILICALIILGGVVIHRQVTKHWLPYRTEIQDWRAGRLGKGLSQRGNPIAANPSPANQNPHSTNPTEPNTTSIPQPFNGQLLSMDCTANNPACPALEIQGDPLPTLPGGKLSAFRGYADPSIQKDPSSNRLWMSYSWPSTHVISVKDKTFDLGVDNHLAYSDDGGKSWHYDKVLWQSYADTNKGGDNGPGWTSNEVSNILPISTDSWVGVRWSYFVPQNSGYDKLQNNSNRLRIAVASNPEDLSNAPTATLGNSATSPAWGVDINLSSLSPEVADCNKIFEPALHYENGTLYLGATCLTDKSSTIVVFSTQPNDDIHSWKWQYVGTLASTKDAKDLGGQGLTQFDFATGTDGTLLAVFSTITGVSGTVLSHGGCKVVEIGSLTSPSLARDSAGKLKVRASITTSDTGAAGNGACQYNPNSATGLLIVRRNQAAGSFTAEIHQTGLKP